MTIRILSYAKFLELSVSDRLTFLEAAEREIASEIARLKSGETQIRDARPVRYYLRLLYLRRQRFVKLAQEAGILLPRILPETA